MGGVENDKEKGSTLLLLLLSLLLPTGTYVGLSVLKVTKQSVKTKQKILSL